MKYLFYILIPALPLIEGMFSYPYFSPKYLVGDSTTPFLQSILLVTLLVWGIKFQKQLSINPISVIFLGLCLFSTFLMTSEVTYLWYSCTILLSYGLVYIDWNDEELIKNINIFTGTLVLITICVWIVRFASKDLDFSATRSGANIYGANALTNLILLGYACNLLRGKTRGSLLYIFTFGVISLMFISRTGLVIAFVLLLSWSLIYFQENKKVVTSAWATGGALLVGVLFYVNSLLETVLARFGFVGDGKSILQILARQYSIQINQQRGILWTEALELSDKYPLLGVGVGEFKNYGSATSAHNMVLNNLAEFGLLFGSLLNILVFLPFFIGFKIQVRKDRYMFLIVYGMFLLQSLTAGQKLVQTTGYISGFALLYLFSVHSLLFQHSRAPRENSLLTK